MLAASTLPFVFWWDVMVDLAHAYEPAVRYFLGWAPWVMMGAGILFFLPVLFSVGRDPLGRFYPRARNAYFGWGVTLYLLGLALATQVARLHAGALAS